MPQQHSQEQHPCLVCEAAADVYCRNDDAYLCLGCDQTIHGANPLASRHIRVPVQPDGAHERTVEPQPPAQEPADVFVVPQTTDFQVPDIDDMGLGDLTAADFHAVFDEDPYFLVPDACGSPLPDSKGKQSDGKLPFSKELGFSQDMDQIFGMTLDDAAWLDNAPSLERVSSALLDSLVPMAKPKTEQAPAPSREHQAPQANHHHHHHQQQQPPQQQQQQQQHHHHHRHHHHHHQPPAPAPYQPAPMQQHQHRHQAPAPVAPPLANPGMAMEAPLPPAPSAVMLNDRHIDIASYVPRTLIPMDPSVAATLLAERRERVQRFFEKKRNRQFKKTIRYASRKAYAEVRPRIKGRFARKDEVAAMRAAGLLPALA